MEINQNSNKAATTKELTEIAKIAGLSFFEKIDEVNPPRELFKGEFSRIFGSWGRTHRIIPIGIEEDIIIAVTSNPLDLRAKQILSKCYNKAVKLLVVPDEEITRIINSQRSELMTERNKDLEKSNKANPEDEILETLKIDVTDGEDDEAPIIRYVNTLIFRAANQRASDIHIEPYEDGLKVRFRIDGVLQDIDYEDRYFQPAILSRIKVMANLDIAEKRLPQDGRIGIKIAGRDVDIRVSTVPTRYGERVVMRLLDKTKVKIELESLGLLDHNLNTLKKLITKSHGIVLVTGPTGSGKTTTLYAALSEINSSDLNILTIEDPIEYELKGVGQMQVNPKIDFTFASGLRSILRQDPDVVMVGEIRDLETVEIAIQASLTGHLVFSTLHTNDAPGAITRLLDMGVEPFLISSSLLAVVAQRLIRVLCNDCKVETALNLTEAKELGLDPKYVGQNIYAANEGGCPTCQRTGYKGRCGIHEMLMVDDEIRQKIMIRADAPQIRSTAKNFLNLRQDGAFKVLQGITSVEEIMRVTQDDILD